MVEIFADQAKRKSSDKVEIAEKSFCIKEERKESKKRGSE
jgi:hypothetical protein